MPKWIPTDVGYSNGGERKETKRNPFYVPTWTALMRGELPGMRGPLYGLILSEVADKQRQLDGMQDAGFLVFRGFANLPDGRKEAIILHPDRAAESAEKMHKVGDAHNGWRGPPKKHRRMANKYVHSVESQDIESGYTPEIFGDHVWPDIKLNDERVRAMANGVGQWMVDTKGTIIGGSDNNGPKSARELRGIYGNLDEARLTSAQAKFGPRSTFNKRQIDDMFGREGGHYRMEDLTLLDLPGHERGGSGEHKTLILEGALRKRG